MVQETQTRRAEKLAAKPGGSGRNPRVTGSGVSNATAAWEAERQRTIGLMSVVVERGNMIAAYQHVVRNKGAAGVDGMTVDELKPYLAVEWVRIRKELLEGRYKPEAVRGVETPNRTAGCVSWAFRRF